MQYIDELRIRVELLGARHERVWEFNRDQCLDCSDLHQSGLNNETLWSCKCEKEYEKSSHEWFLQTLENPKFCIAWLDSNIITSVRKYDLNCTTGYPIREMSTLCETVTQP